MSLHTRRRPVHTLRDHWGMVVWLTVVWVLLWGEVSLGNVLAGLVIAIAATALLPLPTVDFHGRIRPLGLIRLVTRFLADLVVASFQVSFQALRLGHTPRGAVIGIRLRSQSDLYQTFTAEITSLVPGSIVIEAHRATRMLYVHVLDLEASGGIEVARRRVLETEERLLRALASDRELEQIGLPTRRSRREAA